MDKDDQTLVAEKNYAELHKRYEMQIRIFANRLHRGIDKEEFLQEAYFAVVKAVDTARLDEDWNNFFYRVLIHHLRNLMFRMQKEVDKEKEKILYECSVAPKLTGQSIYDQEVDSVQEAEQFTAYSPEKILHEKELMEKTHQWEKEMPKDFLTIVRMRSIGMKVREIAGILGVTPHKVYNILQMSQARASEIFETNWKYRGRKHNELNSQLSHHKTKVDRGEDLCLMEKLSGYMEKLDPEKIQLLTS